MRTYLGNDVMIQSDAIGSSIWIGASGIEYLEIENGVTYNQDPRASSTSEISVIAVVGF